MGMTGPPSQMGPAAGGVLALTRKDVLVAILGLVLQPLPLLPGIQEPAFLLLQHLGTWVLQPVTPDPSPEPPVPSP